MWNNAFDLTANVDDLFGGIFETFFLSSIVYGFRSILWSAFNRQKFLDNFQPTIALNLLKWCHIEEFSYIRIAIEFCNGIPPGGMEITLSHRIFLVKYVIVLCKTRANRVGNFGMNPYKVNFHTKRRNIRKTYNLELKNHILEHLIGIVHEIIS